MHSAIEGKKKKKRQDKKENRQAVKLPADEVNDKELQMAAFLKRSFYVQTDERDLGSVNYLWGDLNLIVHLV